ncbi:MAG: hypothetical protein CML20_01345 [Rheinheimera sp.]|jgi:hypothetical protein|nr:hypothetical protein [Rheinheimera sp.]|tara:strand:+ start:93 stop:464 length:372 start_codon:yes stop_codon:yes gene_type:complete
MKVTHLVLGISLAALFFSDAALASQVKDASSLFKQGGEQAAGAQVGFIQVAGFIGLIVFAFSGMKLFNGRENGQEGKGKLWASLFGGVFFMSLWGFAAITSNTVLGESKSAEQMKSIVSGGSQ